MRKNILKKSKTPSNFHSSPAINVPSKPNSPHNHSKNSPRSPRSQSPAFNVSRGRPCTKQHAIRSSSSMSIERMISINAYSTAHAKSRAYEEIHPRFRWRLSPSNREFETKNLFRYSPELYSFQ